LEFPTKHNSTEDGIAGSMGISDGIPAVPRNRKLSEFPSEPFRARGNNSEFRSVEKNRRNSWNYVPNPPRKRK
jgi:hypothetical protein